MLLLCQGINCRLRINSRKKCKKTPAADEKECADEGSRPEPSVNQKKITSRSWWDGFNRGKHSQGRNEMICTCLDCGRQICFGGSDLGETRERRTKRGKERRGQRYRDKEKAQQQLRIEKSTAFIESEGLNDTAPGIASKKDKKRESGIAQPLIGEGGQIMLPATISERAEAMLGNSYTSKATLFGDCEAPQSQKLCLRARIFLGSASSSICILCEKVACSRVHAVSVLEIPRIHSVLDNHVLLKISSTECLSYVCHGSERFQFACAEICCRQSNLWNECHFKSEHVAETCD
jgi:hypothetical protein